MSQVHRSVRAALLAGVVVVVAGCDLLWAAYGVDPWAPPPPWIEEPAFPEPTILATYSQGTATIEITRVGDAVETITLDRVAPGSTKDGWMGTSVGWRNDAGWVLTLYAYDDSYSMADITLQRIVDLEVWRAPAIGPGGPRCLVDLDESSADAVRGSASCHNLRWEDGLIQPVSMEPTYIEGEAPFAAEITFEATP